MNLQSSTPQLKTQLDRTCFSTSRLLDFCSEKELIAQTGHSVVDWPLAILKELVDNALDACEDAATAPRITVEVNSGEFSASDNGPGIHADTINSVLDFSVRVSSREAYVAPDRGAQGNALKTLVAMPFVLDGKEGRVDVTSHGSIHHIGLRFDQIRQVPVITHGTESANSKEGTIVKVHWPEQACKLVDAKDRFLQLAEDFTFLNPHLTLSVDWFGDKARTDATDAEWSKWRPCDKTPPHWYNRKHLERLIAAHIAHDADGDNDKVRTVGDFVSEFRGLSGTAKRKQILQATDMSRTALADLIREDGSLDGERIDRLLSAMKEYSRPVKPKALGVIGHDHLHQRFAAAGGAMATFNYKKASGVTDDIPWIVETAFAAVEDDDMMPRRLITGVNWSPGILNPFRKLGRYGESLDTVLGDQQCSTDEPVVLLLHMACPRVEYTDRGKSAVVIQG